jgi:RNA polymerase sigma-70 factor (ECF subfamily)
MEMLTEVPHTDPEVNVLAFSAHMEEDALVTSAQAGHHWAFVELCKRCSPMIYRAVFRILKSHHDAEDMLQESFLKAFRALPTFDRRSSFSTWMTRIAINSALMVLRKRAKSREDLRSYGSEDEAGQPELEVADKAPSQEMLCIEAEVMANLQCAIERLPASLRCVVELKHSRGASLEEISSQLNLSVSAVKSRLLRSRIALRQMLEPASVA